MQSVLVPILSQCQHWYCCISIFWADLLNIIELNINNSVSVWMEGFFVGLLCLTVVFLQDFRLLNLTFPGFREFTFQSVTHCGDKQLSATIHKGRAINKTKDNRPNTLTSHSMLNLGEGRGSLTAYNNTSDAVIWKSRCNQQASDFCTTRQSGGDNGNTQWTLVKCVSVVSIPRR